MAIQFAGRLGAFDERTDEFEVALAAVEIAQIRRHFARRGKRRGERDARQVPVFVEVIKQRRKNFNQLSANVRFAGRGLLHHLQPFVVRLADQRLEQARLVAEIIIQRRLGHLRVADDLLDGRGRIAAVGEALERRPEDLSPRPWDRVGP